MQIPTTKQVSHQTSYDALTIIYIHQMAQNQRVLHRAEPVRRIFGVLFGTRKLLP